MAHKRRHRFTTWHMNVAAAAVLVVLVPREACPQSLGLGLGVILGEPTGISAKAWLSRDYALDAAAAWSIHRDGYFQLQADALVHEYDVVELDDVRGRIPFSYGLGARVILGRSDEWVGIRFPLGVSYLFPSAPFDVFFELVPILDLLPETDFDLDAAIGGRFYLGWSGRESGEHFVESSDL